jgi:hypothetical protein
MAGLTRRTMLASSFVVASSRFRRALAQAKAPRRNKLTFGFRSSELRMAAVTERTTFCVTAPFEAPVEAIRIGFANMASLPYRIDGVCCREATGWQPKANASWANFSFSQAGKDIVSQSAPAPQACSVPGSTFGAGGMGGIEIFWSDWISYKTQSPGRPQMLFRVLVPPQSLPLNYWVSAGNVGHWLPNSPVRLIEVRTVRGDQVSNPESMQTPAPQLFVTSLSQFSPLFVVQYRTSTPGIQIVIGGDSHLSAYNTFAFLAAIELSTEALPISVWNTAWSGKPSGVFGPILDEAVDDARPSITLIEGWSANDGMRPATDQAYLIHVREIAERTLRQAGVPIILKGMPRHLFGTEELASWQRNNQALERLIPGAYVFDPLPFVEDNAHPGDWRHDMTDDLIHPNFPAETTLRIPFEALLRQLIS